MQLNNKSSCRDSTIFKKRKKWTLSQLFKWLNEKINWKNFSFLLEFVAVFSMCNNLTMSTEIFWLWHLLTLMKRVHSAFLISFLTNNVRGEVLKNWSDNIHKEFNEERKERKIKIDINERFFISVSLLRHTNSFQ